MPKTSKTCDEEALRLLSAFTQIHSRKVAVDFWISPSAWLAIASSLSAPIRSFRKTTRCRPRRTRVVVSVAL